MAIIAGVVNFSINGVVRTLTGKASYDVGGFTLEGKDGLSSYAGEKVVPKPPTMDLVLVDAADLTLSSLNGQYLGDVFLQAASGKQVSFANPHVEGTASTDVSEGEITLKLKGAIGSLTENGQ